MEITYIVDGVAAKYEADFSNAYVLWDNRMIFKKDYPNVFEALSAPVSTGHHFDFRIVPIQGVKLTKKEVL